MGFLKEGETGVIKVKIVATPNNFAGTTQNGVSSLPYNQYPTAYEVVARVPGK